MTAIQKAWTWPGKTNRDEDETQDGSALTLFNIKGRGKSKTITDFQDCDVIVKTSRFLAFLVVSVSWLGLPQRNERNTL